jgi:Fic family protein
MKSTGAVMNTIAGAFDSSKGDLRLVNVSAGSGGRSYPDYRKVPALLDEFCRGFGSLFSTQCGESDQKRIRREQYEASFKAHLDLVSIHPWLDGNGRSSRLLMNYIQFCFGLVPVKVYNDDKADYIAALRTAQVDGDTAPFSAFMAGELLRNLQEELAGHSA